MPSTGKRLSKISEKSFDHMTQSNDKSMAFFRRRSSSLVRNEEEQSVKKSLLLNDIDEFSDIAQVGTPNQLDHQRFAICS